MRQLIDQILKKHLTGVAYQADKAPELSKQISTEIISGVKRMFYSAYHKHLSLLFHVQNLDLIDTNLWLKSILWKRKGRVFA